MDWQLTAGEEEEAEAKGRLSWWGGLQQPLQSLCWDLGSSALSQPGDGSEQPSANICW